MDTQPGTAAEWFSRAAEQARIIGAPLRAAQSLAGRALAEGSRDWTEALRCAQASTTTPAETEPLAGALARGDAEAVRKALPRARSKLNRPFDAVNLYRGSGGCSFWRPRSTLAASSKVSARIGSSGQWASRSAASSGWPMNWSRTAARRELLGAVATIYRARWMREKWSGMSELDDGHAPGEQG